MAPTQSVRAPSAPREDLLTPVHKGLRSMIYHLGGKLQTADFTDVAATESLLAEMRHDLTAATRSTCVMCHLHEHAGHEEKGFLFQLQVHDPELVEEMLAAHRTISEKLVLLAKQSDEISSLSQPQERVAAGARFTQEANELFAFYLGHMNREESVVVPASWKYFSDDELRAMRGKIMASFTPDQLATMMRWMLPALNVNELTGMFLGLKQGSPPPVFQALTRIAHGSVDPTRWNTVVERVGL